MNWFGNKALRNRQALLETEFIRMREEIAFLQRECLRLRTAATMHISHYSPGFPSSFEVTAIDAVRALLKHAGLEPEEVPATPRFVDLVPVAKKDSSV